MIHLYIESTNIIQYELLFIYNHKLCIMTDRWDCWYTQIFRNLV